MNFQQSLKLPQKQQGATLFTSLVFLTLMTVVSVSATKISMLDILVAGNNQQQMLMFQDTENDLQLLTTPVILLESLYEKKFAGPWVRKLSSEQKVTNRFLEYYCTADGQASSVGSNVPPCFLFDFEAKKSKHNTGMKDKHTRGSGKEFPDLTQHSSLDN
jgi:hypothetical protein